MVTALDAVRARWPRKGVPPFVEFYKKTNPDRARLMDLYVRTGDRSLHDDNWIPAIRDNATRSWIQGIWFQMGLKSGNEVGVLFCFEHTDALEENEFPFERLKSVPFFCRVAIEPDDLAVYHAAAEKYRKYIPGDGFSYSGGYTFGNWMEEHWTHLPERYYLEFTEKFTQAIYRNPFEVCPPITKEFWDGYGHMKLFSKIENDLRPMKRADRNRHFGFTEWAKGSGR